MKESVEGLVTVVTGASAGMGAAIAQRLASEGSRVVLAARRADRLKSLAAEIQRDGGSALAVECDVTDYAQVAAMADRAVAEFGRIDIMVNNAGFGNLKAFTETSVEEIDSQIDVNVKGVCYGSKAVLDHMIGRGTGHIVNIGSIASIRHFASFAVYTAAKHAVLGFSRALYEEVREQGIRVSVLCPAAVNTEFLDVAGFHQVPWPVEDMIQAEDIAELVMTCVTMPRNVQIDSMVVWPTCQAT